MINYIKVHWYIFKRLRLIDKLLLMLFLLNIFINLISFNLPAVCAFLIAFIYLFIIIKKDMYIQLLQKTLIYGLEQKIKNQNIQNIEVN